MKGIFLILLLTISLNSKAFEKDYVQAHCQGDIEVVLPNKVRVDCLTETIAFEYDFAKKFYEAIGQSLYYSILTNRQAGIVLIVTNLKEIIYVERARLVCLKYEILLEVVVDIE